MKFTFKEDVAPNIEELKKMASNKSDANERLKAVSELGKWKSVQSKDVLWRLMMNDLVYDVQNEAFLRLQSFGEAVKLPKKKKGNLINQIDKKIEKIAKTIENEILFSDFIKIFKNKLPIEFDVYQHDKKNNFEKWLKNIINNFPKELSSKIK